MSYTTEVSRMQIADGSGMDVIHDSRFEFCALAWFFGFRAVLESTSTRDMHLRDSMLVMDEFLLVNEECCSDG